MSDTEIAASQTFPSKVLLFLRKVNGRIWPGQ